MITDIVTLEWFKTQLREVTLLSTFVRLFIAAFFGGMIGMGRASRRRAAGMRTHMLVCMGAAFVMITQQYITIYYPGSDPSRLGAQVISGIGFLGVGTIIVDRGQQVRGLTTAAGLWSSACMGLAIGIGFYSGSILACTFILATLTIMNKLEYRIVSSSRRMTIYAEFNIYSDINRLVSLAGENTISISRLEIVQPKGYTGADDTRSAAVITLLLAKRCAHYEIINLLGSSPGLITIEDVEAV